MELRLEAIRQIGSEREADGAFHLEFATSAGTIEGRLHVGATANSVIIWTGVPHEHARALVKPLIDCEVASLIVGHRHPHDAEQCVIDLLVSVYAMNEANFEDVIIAGVGEAHATARMAADASEKIKAVVLPNSAPETLAVWLRPDLAAA